ncbi:hypothetical protein E2C01_021107 [Portunus trituberculatus]|uniref:Uncharacterized protein n=1 Tax=Portunus trituberculatus TaxID=210409 RepID=A0A5B7E3C4_PORTR|nr:hypothetical protein [Portunus trituberculatus]
MQDTKKHGLTDKKYTRKRKKVTTSGDGNITTSSLVFTPQPEHDDAMLRCLAETHADLSALEDTVNLTVHCKYRWEWRGLG